MLTYPTMCVCKYYKNAFITGMLVLLQATENLLRMLLHVIIRVTKIVRLQNVKTK